MKRGILIAQGAVTIIVSILVTGLACLSPVRSATDVNPAVVLKGE